MGLDILIFVLYMNHNLMNETVKFETEEIAEFDNRHLYRQGGSIK